jgi:outer membrane lipoprotein LolB
MRPASIVLAAALLAAGCAHVPPESDGLDLATRRARLAALAGWDMRGRLAVDTGERAFQARFRWLAEADTVLLNVRGPFGAGSFEIAGDDTALTVRTRGETLQLRDPESDLSALFGWWLPVGSLDTWLLGLPDAAFVARTRTDADGRVRSLEQRSWRVEYADYRLSEGFALPGTIDMRYGPLHLHLTVDAWTPTAALPATP